MRHCDVGWRVEPPAMRILFSVMDNLFGISFLETIELTNCLMCL